MTLHTSCARNEYHGCLTKRGSSRCHRHGSSLHNSQQSLGPCIPSDLYRKMYRARHQCGAQVWSVSFWERRPVDIHQTCDSSCCGRRSPSFVVLLRCGKPCVVLAKRVTVPVVLADHPLLLSYRVVGSPALSLLIGRDVVERLGLDIKGSSKTTTT